MTEGVLVVTVVSCGEPLSPTPILRAKAVPAGLGARRGTRLEEDRPGGGDPGSPLPAPARSGAAPTGPRVRCGTGQAVDGTPMSALSRHAIAAR